MPPRQSALDSPRAGRRPGMSARRRGRSRADRRARRRQRRVRLARAHHHLHPEVVLRALRHEGGTMGIADERGVADAHRALVRRLSGNGQPAIGIAVARQSNPRQPPHGAARAVAPQHVLRAHPPPRVPIHLPHLQCRAARVPRDGRDLAPQVQFHVLEAPQSAAQLRLQGGLIEEVERRKTVAEVQSGNVDLRELPAVHAGVVHHAGARHVRAHLVHQPGGLVHAQRLVVAAEGARLGVPDAVALQDRHPRPLQPQQVGRHGAHRPAAHDGDVRIDLDFHRSVHSIGWILDADEIPLRLQLNAYATLF